MASYIFIIGPACTGKTTFSYEFTEYTKQQKIKFSSLNLDCANLNGHHEYNITEKIEYDRTVDGPNSALLLSYKELKPEFFPDTNLIIDCPGQIELYLHNENFLMVLNELGRNNKIIILFLIDSFSHKKYLSSIFLSTMVQSRFLFPYINVRRGKYEEGPLNGFEHAIKEYLEDINIIEMPYDFEDIYNECLRIIT